LAAVVILFGLDQYHLYKLSVRESESDVDNFSISSNEDIYPILLTKLALAESARHIFQYCGYCFFISDADKDNILPDNKSFLTVFTKSSLIPHEDSQSQLVQLPVHVHHILNLLPYLAQ
jgi:hypothetical protein